MDIGTDFNSQQRDLKNPVALGKLAKNDLKGYRLMPKMSLQYDFFDPEKQYRIRIFRLDFRMLLLHRCLLFLGHFFAGFFGRQFFVRVKYKFTQKSVCAHQK